MKVVTVKDAFVNGADHVVIGRPIREATEPNALVEKMQQDIIEVIPTISYT